MGFRWFGIVFGSVLLALATAQVQAQTTRYISEELEVGIRAGKTLQHRIIRSGRAGEQVTVVQQDADGHSLIRLPNGTEGWILTRYLQDEPHSRERLALVQAELDAIRSDANDETNQIALLLEERRGLETERNLLRGRISALERELVELRDVAARPQEIRDQNSQLRDALLHAQETSDDFRRQVELLRTDNQRRWFLTGAFVTVGSLLVGILLTRIPRRRRRDEW